MGKFFVFKKFQNSKIVVRFHFWGPNCCISTPPCRTSCGKSIYGPKSTVRGDTIVRSFSREIDPHVNSTSTLVGSRIPTPSIYGGISRKLQWLRRVENRYKVRLNALRNGTWVIFSVVHLVNWSPPLHKISVFPFIWSWRCISVFWCLLLVGVWDISAFHTRYYNL